MVIFLNCPSRAARDAKLDRLPVIYGVIPVPEGTVFNLVRCRHGLSRSAIGVGIQGIRFPVEGDDLQGDYRKVCFMGGGDEVVYEPVGNGILPCAWIGTPRSIVSIKMQTLFEMASFISIIINEQTSGTSVLSQIAQGLDDEFERTI